jgi:coenzyme F420-reducing hydrogenase beta subunit
MQSDSEGFLYPEINTKKCAQCGLCKKVCPALNQGYERKPLLVYAAKNKNEEIRNKSSSGGIFTLLAEQIIRNGGVVFGSRFNEKWEVIHDCVENIDGLAAYRGSKYVQSNIGTMYRKAKEFLEMGREVLFSGTPCQITGLKTFLAMDYEKLLTVDLVCHGVPSPAVWGKYLVEILAMAAPPPPARYYHSGRHENISVISFRDKTYGWKINYSFHMVIQMTKNKDISTINFRDKSLGWKQKSFKIIGNHESVTVIITEPSRKNVFMRGFLHNLYLRPSCYHCPSKLLKSGSDITLGDFWGIQNIMPEFDDDKGISLVLINTLKGKYVYDKLNKDDIETSYDNALTGNPSIERSVMVPLKRAIFFQEWQNNKVIPLIDKLTHASFGRKIISFTAVILKKTGLLPVVKAVLRRGNEYTD